MNDFVNRLNLPYESWSHWASLHRLGRMVDIMNVSLQLHACLAMDIRQLALRYILGPETRCYLACLLCEII